MAKGKKGKKKATKKGGLTKQPTGLDALLATLAEVARPGGNGGGSDEKSLAALRRCDELAARLREVQRPVVTESTPDWGAFRDWLLRGGASLNGVGFGVSPTFGCNGVLCSEALDRGHAAICVPRKLMILSEVPVSDPSGLGKLVATDPFLRKMPMVVLALRLLQESMLGESSSFAPYLRMLPRSFPGLPLYYSPEELLALRASPSTLRTAVRRSLDTMAYYSYLQRAVLRIGTMESLGLGGFALDDFRWAVAIAMTRQNPVPASAADSQSGKHLALIPAFDLCNHEEGGEFSTEFDIEADALRCYAMRDFALGEEFTMHYGPRSSEQLLVYSGFVPTPPSLHDAATLTFELHSEEPFCSDPLLKIKILLLRKLALMQSDEDNFETTLRRRTDRDSGGGTDLCDSRVLSFARIMAMDKAEATAVLKGEFGVVNDLVPFVGRENELRALEMLDAAFVRALDVVPAHLAQKGDAATLGPRLPFKLAALLRTGETMILQHEWGAVKQQMADLGTGDDAAQPSS